MALIHPQIDPNIFSIGPIHATWYGFMYVLGFACVYIFGSIRSKKAHACMTVEQLSDFLTYVILGVILGGRIGYVLFYGLSFWADDWLYPLKIYQGGMSFHGGLIGVTVACFLFSRRINRHFLEVGDFIAPLVPFGLFFGRIGNFINGELWGKTTNFFLGMVFPGAGNLPRHPSQLYESFFEGLVLFIILWIYSSKPRKAGSVAGLFLLGYAVARFLIEFVRMPDAHLGYIAFGWLTQGQILTLPMFLFGAYLLLRKYPVLENKKTEVAQSPKGE